MIRIWKAALLLCLLPLAAHAEDLVSGLSQDLIEITSNYTGTEIVVFGAIESAASGQSPVPRDVVVVVRGPEADMTVRRKAHIAGLWINRDKITLYGMPSYYFVASTRPLSKIASNQILARYQIGLENIVPRRESTRSAAKGEPFRVAAIRERQSDHLYIARPEGVEFLSYSLFRVHVPVPATVLRGQYTAEVYLFADGIVTSAQSTPLFVDQIGIERRLNDLAQHWPFAYGLAAVVLAVLMGWLSSVVFRRA